MITPKECGQLTDAEHVLVAAYEKQIDGELSRRYRGGGYVAVTLRDVELYGRVVDELIRRYSAAGWSIERIGDQRDGDFLRFSAPAS